MATGLVLRILFDFLQYMYWWPAFGSRYALAADVSPSISCLSHDCGKNACSTAQLAVSPLVWEISTRH